MPPCFCSFNPPSTSISKFISDQPFLSMLENHCQSIKDLKKIHAQLIKSGLAKDTVAASRVVAFCAASPARDLDYALSIFRRIERPSLFTWNTVIRGFSQSSDPHVAVSLFVEMLISPSAQPEKITYPSVFKAYTQLGLATDGAQLHGRIVKLGLGLDPYIRNSILHMYANCGLLRDAWKLFDRDEHDTDVVAWNSMVMGLAKAGEVQDSWSLFCKMPFRNEISWNTMISGYVRNGEWIKALDLFDEMQRKRITPTEFTLVSVLNACAKLGALEQGKWVHDYIKKSGIDCNSIVITAIIDMYCKCGEIETGRRVFEAAPRKGLSCWNSMMLGLATNGFEDEAFELFLKLESSYLRPDSVSFIAVLTACNHSVRVGKAREYFKLMQETYRIKPTIKHYGCMVDVLGRAGLIREAAEVVTSMPMKPDAIIWGSLLSGCASSRQNVEVAEWAAENLIVSDGDETTSAHVLLSNVYAASGDFEKAVEEREKMKKKVVEKPPGCSLIQVNGEIHEFLAGGNWHSQPSKGCGCSL